MNTTKMQNRKRTFDAACSDEAQSVMIENSPHSMASTGIADSYSLGTNGTWTDQGLNRILTTVEDFDKYELNEVECLEMLFYLSSRRQDARRVAEAAIEAYGSLAKVFQRPSKELREILGLDCSMTALLAIAKSSLKFFLAPELQDRQEVRSYEALMKYVTLDLRGAEQEILRVIFLDTKCRIIRDEEIARGTVNAVPLYPREIAKKAIAYCASTVILAHNHLSDNPTPSRNDITKTIQTRGALQLLEVDLQDHVIVARRSCFSMRKHGLI